MAQGHALRHSPQQAVQGNDPRPRLAGAIHSLMCLRELSLGDCPLNIGCGYDASRPAAIKLIQRDAVLSSQTSRRWHRPDFVAGSVYGHRLGWLRRVRSLADGLRFRRNLAGLPDPPQHGASGCLLTGRHQDAEQHAAVWRRQLDRGLVALHREQGFTLAHDVTG